MKNDELLDLINDKDEVIGTVWKSEAHKDPKKIHREVAIVIFNEKNEVLLQRRSMKKKHHPGRWALTAGHVSVEEDPAISAKRELLEELGWNKKLKFLGKMFRIDNSEARIFWVYYLKVTGHPETNFDSEEIMDTRWVEYSKLEKFSRENLFYLNGTSHTILREAFEKLKMNKRC